MACLSYTSSHLTFCKENLARLYFFQLKYSKENSSFYFSISRNLQKRFVKPNAKLRIGTVSLSLYKNTKNYRYNINTKLQIQSYKKLQNFIYIVIPWQKLYTKINEIENHTNRIVKTDRKSWEGILTFKEREKISMILILFCTNSKMFTSFVL